MNERISERFVFLMQILSVCAIWVFSLAISVWIIHLIRLSRRLHDAPTMSVGISIVAIPVFLTGASVLTYVFVGLRKGRRDNASDSLVDGAGS